MNLGIYIHIPFCKSRCYYCDFCSTDKSKIEEQNNYIVSLINEILDNAEILSTYEVDSIYFGGGTPSLIAPENIIKVLDILRSCTSISANAEITIEVNPESITYEKLVMYKEAGINRISIGLQSANNDVLKNIGRISTKEMFAKAYENILEAGFNNISTDIICGLPNDTVVSFIDTIEYALSLPKLKHISVYSLEVYENSKLDFLIKNDFLKLPDEDTEREMKHILDKKAAEAGFNIYEISNYAKAGFESKHNLKYWTGKPYLGFGASAASYINSTRYSNTKNISEYISSTSNEKYEVEELDMLELEKEFVILGLRLTKGISKAEFYSKFKTDIYMVFGEEINKCVSRDLLKVKGDSIYLTSKGQDLANLVWQEFI